MKNMKKVQCPTCRLAAKVMYLGGLVIPIPGFVQNYGWTLSHAQAWIVLGAYIALAAGIFKFLWKLDH
jgi:hypothetical protein